MPPESETPGNEPNLELPSFGLGRKRKRGRNAGGAAPADAATPPAAASEDPATEAPAAPSDGSAPARPAAPRAPVAPPPPARVPGAAPAPARPAARPPARPPARPAAAVTPPPPTPRPAPPKPAAAKPAVHPPSPSPVVPPAAVTPAETPESQADETGAEPTAVLPATSESVLTTAGVDPLDAAAAALDAPPKSRRSKGSERAAARAARREEKAARREEKAADREEEVRQERPAPADALVARLPAINPVVAAILTGTLSGLAAVLLAFGAARGCEQVRNTDSCGGGLGLLAIVAILALEVVIGANLLKAWQISDPFSTSFLGVGLVATLAMLIFLDDLNSPWMLLVIPLMTAVAFALSWWVTVRFIDEYDEHPPGSVPEDEDSNA